MGDRAPQIEGFGFVGNDRQRFVCRDLRLAQLASTRAYGHLGQPAIGAAGVDASGIFDGFERGLAIAEIRGSPGLHQQQLEACACWQSGLGEARLLEDLLLLGLGDHGLRQRNNHLVATDSQAQCFGERCLGCQGVAAVQQRLAQQDMHRQHVLVDLQRVLQLDDRSG